jgi:hypothetical protein
VLPAGPFTDSTTTKDYGSIRGRLGVAFDRFLIFGAGGWAIGNPSAAFALTGAASFVTTGVKSDGWTAGAGVECAITDTILGRIEYQYTSLEALGFALQSTSAPNIADLHDNRDRHRSVGTSLRDPEAIDADSGRKPKSDEQPRVLEARIKAAKSSSGGQTLEANYGIELKKPPDAPIIFTSIAQGPNLGAPMAERQGGAPAWRKGEKRWFGSAHQRL